MSRKVEPAGDSAGFGLSIFENHAALLAASAIAPEVARERKYVSVDTKTRLGHAGFSPVQRRVPGLLIPIHGVTGDVVGHEYRPDVPRVTDAGRTLKYEKPAGSVNRLDVPPRVRPVLADPLVPLWVTEGARKVDAAVSVGLACVGLAGVYGWRATDKDTGGKVALGDWESVALNGRDVILAFDCDIETNSNVRTALGRLRRFLESRGARVRVCVLPDEGDGKTGLDDFLAAGHTVAELEACLATPSDISGFISPEPMKPEMSPPVPATLDEVVDAYRRWLCMPDEDPLLAVLGTYAASLLPGDPVWLFVVAGSGWGKTETLEPLRGLADVRFASVLTEAGLLSGTSKKERAEHATGGILREIGKRGTLVLKDFTSVLEMNRDTRASLLAALREVFDGHWVRHVGTDGGQAISWRGKLGVVAATTNAVDRAHGVMAIMGPRFLSIRLREADAHKQAVAALAQSGRETAERAKLADTVRGLFANGVPTQPCPLDHDGRERLVRLAALVVRARSAVSRDYSGDVDLVPDAEAPTRLAKSIERLYAGVRALGCDDSTAWRVCARVGLDTIPRLRRAVLDVLADTEAPVSTGDVATKVRHPTKTTLRALEDLHAHGVIARSGGGRGKAYEWQLAVKWKTQYREAVLAAMKPEMSDGVDASSNGHDPATALVLKTFDGATLVIDEAEAF